MKITQLTSPLLLLVVTTLCFFGCEKPERTIDELRQEISAFRAVPDDEKFVSIEKHLAELDASILKLRNAGKVEQANHLQEQRDSLASDFGAAKVHRTLQDAKSALKGIQDVIQKTGDSLRENPSSETTGGASSSPPSTNANSESPASEASSSSEMTAPTPEVAMPNSSPLATPNASQMPTATTPIVSPIP